MLLKRFWSSLWLLSTFSLYLEVYGRMSLWPMPREAAVASNGGHVALCLAETVAELEAIVGLHAFHFDVSPAEKGNHFF